MNAGCAFHMLGFLIGSATGVHAWVVPLYDPLPFMVFCAMLISLTGEMLAILEAGGFQIYTNVQVSLVIH